MKIEKLTPAQDHRKAEFIRKWTDIGLCTAPADRPRAEAAIVAAYAAVGKPAPKIVWCGSPLSQGMTRAIILDEKFAAKLKQLIGEKAKAIKPGASVGASVRDSVGASGYGQHDAHWLGFIEYFREVCGLIGETEKAQGLTELAKSAGWFLPHENICWVSERHHLLERDERGRLHCLTGPAIAYPDGWAVYAVHGVRLPAWIIEHPEQITVAKIDAESNAEIRRVMIERYGADKYMLDSGAKPIQRDRCGILYRKTVPGDEDLVMVRVLNSTPEQDGVLTEAQAREVFGDEVVDDNLAAMRRIGFKAKDKELLKRPRFKEYFLRVPPQMRTALEAVAWTYDLKPADYKPQLQT